MTWTTPPVAPRRAPIWPAIVVMVLSAIGVVAALASAARNGMIAMSWPGGWANPGSYPGGMPTGMPGGMTGGWRDRPYTGGGRMGGGLVMQGWQIGLLVVSAMLFAAALTYLVMTLHRRSAAGPVPAAPMYAGAARYQAPGAYPPPAPGYPPAPGSYPPPPPGTSYPGQPLVPPAAATGSAAVPAAPQPKAPKAPKTPKVPKAPKPPQAPEVPAAGADDVPPPPLDPTNSG